MRRLSVLWFLFAVTLSATAQDIPVISPTGRWVSDTAGMLSPNEESTLVGRLSSYGESTSTQIVVVTIPSLDGYAASEYATELGRKWGVGQSEYNNGVVLLVSRDDREVFIATGYGLEGAIPDAVASRIVRNVIIPQFKRGNFYGGISEAVDALVAASEGEYEPPASDGSDGVKEFIVFVILLTLLIIVIVVIANMGKGSSGGNKPRKRRRRTPVIIWGDGGHRTGWGSSSGSWGSGGGFGGFGGGGFGGGGFSGGGGSFGGGGAGGSW